MATGSKAIATKENCNSIVSGAFTSSKECVTYQELIYSGKFNVSTTLDDKRLTRYEYISKKDIIATATPNPTTINAAGTAGGGGSSTITVTNATGWTASVDSAYTSWLTCTSSGSTLIASCKTANTGSSSRTGYITVTPTGIAFGATVQTSKVTVVQSAATQATINSSISSIDFLWDPEADDTSRTATITYSNATGWTATSSASWLTVSKSGNALIITTPDTNSGARRTATITLTTTGGETNASTTISVSQAAGPGKAVVIPITMSFTAGTESKAHAFTVTLTNAAGFTVASNASWLSYNKLSGRLGDSHYAVVTANSSSSSRYGQLTITPTGLSNISVTPTSATITVTQSGSGATVPTISVTPTSVSFSASGGSRTVTVTYGGTATGWTVASKPSFCSTSKSGNTLTITASANTGSSSRTGKVSVQAQVNGTNSGTPATVSVSQSHGAALKTVNIKRHIFTIPKYNTSSANYYVQIPGVVVYNGSGVDIASVIKNTSVNTSYTSYSTSAELSSLPTSSFSIETLPATSNTLSGCYSIYKKGENGARGTGYSNVVSFGTANSEQMVTLTPDPVFMECTNAPTGNTDEFHIVYQDTTQASHVPSSQTTNTAPGWIDLNLSLGQLTVRFPSATSWSASTSSVYVVFSTSAVASSITTKAKWISTNKAGRLAVSSSITAGGSGAVLKSGTWSHGYIGVYVGGYLWQGQITAAVATTLNNGSTTSINLTRTRALN